jgi:hypothetical protein
MKKLWPNKKSHQLWFLGALLLPLTACGFTPTPPEDAYRVSLSSLGYEVNDTGKIIVASVTANMTATAGAPDVRELDYTAVLLDSKGKPAAIDDSKIAPANGTLMVGAKGGYRCTGAPPTPEGACVVNSSDAIWSNNGSWATNTVSRAIVPGEWAVAHLASFQGTTTGSAQWYAEFTYTAYMTTGQAVSWKQRYQFLIPVKAGS